jgi:C-terminal processing protease CtpA/Prc
MSGRSWFVLIVSIAAILIVGLALAADKAGKAYLGIVPSEITSDIAGDYGTQAGAGVLVDDVASGSPADKAGLRENDVILKIGDQSPTGPEEFRKLLEKYKPDDTVELTCIRGGKQKTVSVKLGEKKDWNFNWWPKNGAMKEYKFKGAPWEWRSATSDKKRAFAGVVAQNLSGGLASYFKVEKGALIAEIVKNSPAEAAGLKAGDVIVKIGDDKIEDEGDVSTAIHKHKPGDAVDFVITRDGQTSTIKVTLGERSADTGHIIRMHRGDAPMGEIDIPDMPDLGSLDEHLKDVKIRIKDLKDLQDLDSLSELKDLQIELEDVPDFDVDSLQMRIITPDRYLLDTQRSRGRTM